jgi:hypothetical protein
MQALLHEISLVETNYGNLLNLPGLPKLAFSETSPIKHRQNRLWIGKG